MIATGRAPRCLTLLLAAMLAAAGCSADAGPGRGPASGIVIGAGYEPDTLNPVLGFAPDGASKVFDGLVDRDANLRLRPALAAALPAVSADGLTWRADLRPGVRFHDGSPLTASDVAYTYTAVLDPKNNSTIASGFDALDSVRAVDSDTVEFRLKYPYQPFAQRLTLGIVPRAALAGKDFGSAAFNGKPIGTGPYEVVSWRRGDRLVLRANPRYHRGAPKVRDVTIVFSTDDNVRAQRMAAGEFDATVLPPKLAMTYQGRVGYRVIASPTADYRGVGLPFELPLTSDPRVRQAINLGLDRQAMITSILAGKGIPAATPISPHLAQWYDRAATFPHDPARAGRLLDEAGWKAGADGVRRKGGQVAELPILYPGPDVLRKELALAAASDLTELGIRARAESSTFEQMLARRATTAGLWGGGDPYDPDSAAYTLLHSQYISEQGYVNMTRYRDAAVDRALDQGREGATTAVRQQAYQAFQEQYMRNPAWAFLVFLDHTYVLRDKWTGLQDQVEPHDHGLIHGPWWNLEAWTPKAS
jgi:peptide/nickel transport system substrate-binding protein